MTDPTPKYLCTACGHRFFEPGMCLHCKDEPLLDADCDRTVQYLKDDEDRRRRRHDRILTAVAAPPTGLVLVGCAYLAWRVGGVNLIAVIWESEAAGVVFLIPAAIVYGSFRLLAGRIWRTPGKYPWSRDE